VPRISDARKQEVRNQLIDAAVEVLVTEGPSGVTSRRVLARAGLSAGALYHYFASLDELYTAVAERFVELDRPLFALAAEDDQLTGTADRQLEILRDLFARGDQVLLGQLRATADTNGGVRHALQEYDRVTVEQAGALNRASQEEGLLRADVDVDALVELVGVFFEGFNIKSRATGFATSRERVLRLFLDLLHEGVVEPAHPDAPRLAKEIREVAAP
jgi:AcrR family transcriptional regulator